MAVNKARSVMRMSEQMRKMTVFVSRLRMGRTPQNGGWCAAEMDHIIPYLPESTQRRQSAFCTFAPGSFNRSLVFFDKPFQSPYNPTSYSSLSHCFRVAGTTRIGDFRGFLGFTCDSLAIIRFGELSMSIGRDSHDRTPEIRSPLPITTTLPPLGRILLGCLAARWRGRFPWQPPTLDTIEIPVRYLGQWRPGARRDGLAASGTTLGEPGLLRIGGDGLQPRRRAGSVWAAYRIRTQLTFNGLSNP